MEPHLYTSVIVNPTQVFITKGLKVKHHQIWEIMYSGLWYLLSKQKGKLEWLTSWKILKYLFGLKPTTKFQCLSSPSAFRGHSPTAVVKQLSFLETKLTTAYGNFFVNAKVRFVCNRINYPKWFVTINCFVPFKNCHSIPDWCGSVDWVPAWKPKGRRPGPQLEACKRQLPLSVSLLPFSFPSPPPKYKIKSLVSK